MSDFFKNIGKAMDDFTESIWEKVEEGFDSANEFLQKVKGAKISVKISNTVETSDPLRQLSLLAERTWVDLLSENKKCKLDGPINAPDLFLIIGSRDGKLFVDVQSEFLKKEEAKKESEKEVKDLFEKMNKTIDELLRGGSLEIEDLTQANKTKKTQALIACYEKKISKIIFVVLVKKIAAEL